MTNYEEDILCYVMNGNFPFFKRPCPMNLSVGPEWGLSHLSQRDFCIGGCRRLSFLSRLWTAVISDDSVNSICSSVSLWYFKAAFYDSLANYFAGILIKSCHKGICYLGEWLPDRCQMAEKQGGRGDGSAHGGRGRRLHVKGHGLAGAQIPVGAASNAWRRFKVGFSFTFRTTCIVIHPFMLLFILVWDPKDK